jgi:hypothetical protein
MGRREGAHRAQPRQLIVYDARMRSFFEPLDFAGDFFFAAMGLTISVS